MSEPNDGILRRESFTERLNKALTLAWKEAERFNHAEVGPEHLLLGMAAEGQGVGAKLLASLGVDSPRLREAVLLTVGRGSGPKTQRPRELSAQAGRLLDLAEEASASL